MNDHRIVNQADIKALHRLDKLFARIDRQYGPPPDWSREPGFVSLCKIILEQQVSLASANAHFSKLCAYLEDFSPTHLLSLSDEEMRACQISRQKTKYLRALAAEITGGTLDLAALAGLAEPQVRERLIRIKGIGHWTTDIYLMFCLQAKDIFPIGDIAVVNTVRAFAGDITLEEIRAMAEAWCPYRSLATYYLWHHYLSKRKN